jgi:hypothetical protein
MEFNSSNTTSENVTELLAILDAPTPVVAKKPRKLVRAKKADVEKQEKEAMLKLEEELKAKIVEELEEVALPHLEIKVIEDEEEDNEYGSDNFERLAEEADAYIGENGGTIEFVAKYKAMVALAHKYEAMIKRDKNENSPVLEEGIHMRIVDGVKTQCRYIFPYKADGGKSMVKEMKDGAKVLGVSTTQKNNSKNSCKVADYKLTWVNNKIVKDDKTGKTYAHKDGKFAIVDGETSFNVRLMVRMA